MSDSATVDANSKFSEKGKDFAPPSKIRKIDHSTNTTKFEKNHADTNKNPKFESRREKWQKKDAKFHYGNYDRYYGKRAIHAGHSKSVDNCGAKPEFDDPRLTFFKRECFENKKILDVGCNVGYMTVAVAHRFSPSKITGLDIDGNLIRSAITNVKKKFGPSKVGQGGNMNGKDDSGTSAVNEGTASTDNGKMDQLSDSEKATLRQRIWFESGNYVLGNDELLDCVHPEYDVILALSLTKWIHLNWGDDGIKRFFRRIYRHLYPGGILLLEPQPWSTYKKRRGLTPEIAHNYDNIRFKPDRFRPYLLGAEVGFESCEVINKVESEAKGFSRPIYLFRKPMRDNIPTDTPLSIKAVDDGDGECSKNESSGNGSIPTEEVTAIGNQSDIIADE